MKPVKQTDALNSKFGNAADPVDDDDDRDDSDTIPPHQLGKPRYQAGKRKADRD